MPGTRYEDRVKETTTTTGTGAITLAGAVAQFISFNSALGVGVPFYYAIVGQSGTEWEVGEGILTGTTTMSRDPGTPSLRSSNANALVNFSAGTKDVWMDDPAYHVRRVATRGKMVSALAGQDLLG